MRCQRADIAQTEHRGAVGDDRDQVAARSVFEGIGRIGDDFFAGAATPGEYAKRQVALVGQLLGGGDADFAGRGEFVVFECRLPQLLTKFFFLGNERIHAVRPSFFAYGKLTILSEGKSRLIRIYMNLMRFRHIVQRANYLKYNTKMKILSI